MAISDEPVKIGQPYQQGGVTYTPTDDLLYDEVGYASWYGEELHGNTTANGESFNAAGVSAAHRTLPMPSYVEITALDSGKTILARVNDRGPFSNDRLIDLSRGAAEQLGISGQGAAAVRVRRVNPPEQERVALRSGRQAALRMDAPDALLIALRKNLASMPKPSSRTTITLQDIPASSVAQPKVAAPKTPQKSGPKLGYTAPSNAADDKLATTKAPAQKPQPQKTTPKTPRPAPTQSVSVQPEAVKKGNYAVQVAAFSSQSRAQQAAKRIKGFVSQKGAVWRVRLGPYADREAARRGVAQAAASGFQGAQIVVND